MNWFWEASPMPGEQSSFRQSNTATNVKETLCYGKGQMPLLSAQV